MAGAGFKTFATGDVLTASDVNTYLMQQTVMVFASAAARSTALGGNVAQGMISYLKDSNTTAYYDGTAWQTLSTGGDITGVTAGTGISGGGTSGDVTVTNSMATAMTTKGDLVPATGSGTFARLAAGSDGSILVANSAASTGLGWAGQPYSNPVLNSAFQIWQRGTSIALAASTSSTNGFFADRWQTSTGANQATTISRQATSDTTNLPNIQYCARFQRNSGQTGTSTYYPSTTFESINSIPFAGKQITLSFYARAGANYSATSSGLGVTLASGTGTDQNIQAGFTGQVSVINQTATLTTTWQRFTYTGTIGATATQLGLYFTFTPTGTAGANDYFEITGVQIDLGSVALPFRTYAATIQGELAACQRYCYIINGSTTSPLDVNGAYYTSTRVLASYNFPVTMRTTPSPTYSSQTMITIYSNGASRVCTAIASNDISTQTAVLDITTAATTAGHAAIASMVTASTSITWSAEL